MSAVLGAKRPLFSRRSGLGLVAFGLPAAMFAALAVAAPEFSSFQNLSNVNSQITALLIVSLGQLVVAVIGGVDISVGSVVSLTSVFLVSLDPALALPAAVLLGLAVGLANGVGAGVFGVHPLVMTLASMTFLQGLALLIRSGAGGVVPPAFLVMAKADVFGLPAAALWCALALAAASLLVYGTRFGLRIFAVGANPGSAALSGVRVVPLRLACYVLCSLSGVVAGAYLTGRIASGDPQMGQSFGLDSITAVALGGVQLSGGVGSVAGAALGTLTLGLITNGMNLLGVSPFFRGALTGVLLLGAVSLQRRKAIGV